MTHAKLGEIHEVLLRQLDQQAAIDRSASSSEPQRLVDAILYSPGNEVSLECHRLALKPETDLVDAALRLGAPAELSVPRSHVLVGDNLTDLIAGHRAGVSQLMLVRSSHHGKEAARILASASRPDDAAPDASDVAGRPLDPEIRVLAQRAEVFDDLAEAVVALLERHG
jgi:histidinol phosphatase-like enzyme